MKTKEFIKRVEELGFKVFNESDYYVIKDEYEDNVANVNKTTLTQMSTDYIEWDEVYDGDKTKLFNLLVEYARTPIEDREEEKYYLVKFTLKEIEEIKKKFDIDLSDFELVEVEE